MRGLPGQYCRCDILGMENKVIITSNSPLYARAFEQYLRKGTSLEVSIKALIKAQEHLTPYYIWRTAGDDKVRPSHAANEGRIFAWNNPPATGNPGEAINCRCSAEPYNPRASEYAYQELVSAPNDSAKKWTDIDFVKHFYIGRGRLVTLAEIGHQAGVTEFYFYKIYREGKNSYTRVNEQIIEKARKIQSGSFVYDFGGSYPFGGYLKIFGGGSVNGIFNGSVTRQQNILSIQGEIDYRYTDTFTDPRSLRQRSTGTSDPLAVGLPRLFITDFGGVFYDIVGTWKTRFVGQANADEKESSYK